MPGQRLLQILTAVLVLAGLNGFAAGGGEAGALGSIAGRGEVWVDNQPVPPGTALYGGDVISTGKASTALMSLLSGSSATITENSEVALSHGANPTNLNLRRGALLVRNPGPQATRVSVLGASVLVRGQDDFPAICRIAAAGRSAAVFADRGRVEIHGAGAPLILPPGKYVTLEAGKPPGAGQQAGRVSSAIPEEVVQRQGQTAEVPLKLSDGVNWQDMVKTLRTGRVRIELLDGSFLNVGARSVMKIVRHDAQTQQTQVELSLGRLRGEVVKLTKSGASFQVQTQTAVIGVVGTIFVILARPNLTRVFCIDGALSVRNINPVIAGAVTVRAGQFANVPRGFPPTAALQAPSGQIQNQVSQTNAGGPPGPAGAAAPTGGAAGAASTVTNTATAGAGATTAALSGVALSKVGSANDTLTQADTALQSAQSTSSAAASEANAAISAANAASAAATTVETGIQTVQPILSPSGPGCGCQ